jgi:hypothetical protein
MQSTIQRRFRTRWSSGGIAGILRANQIANYLSWNHTNHSCPARQRPVGFPQILVHSYILRRLLYDVRNNSESFPSFPPKTSGCKEKCLLLFLSSPDGTDFTTSAFNPLLSAPFILNSTRWRPPKGKDVRFLSYLQTHLRPSLI